MKFSLEWIKDYCDTELTVEELVERLTIAGLEVEGYERVGGDVGVELEITANRPDCLSLIGIARELAAATGKSLKMPLNGYGKSTQQAYTHMQARPSKKYSVINPKRS